jgi:hypothetical protein
MITLTRARALRVVVGAGTVGALTLVEPRRLGPLAHGAYRVGIAAATAALVADSSRYDLPVLDPVRDGVVAGGVTLGLMEVLESLDARMVDALQGRGITRPRLALAALGAVGTAAVIALPHLGEPDRGWAPLEESFGEPSGVPLPSEARALIAALLADPEDAAPLPGAQALREQLAIARGLDTGGAGADLQLVVDHPERLAVPRQQLWPVRAEFRRGGIRYELELQIDDGRLGMLSVMVPDEEPRLEHALSQLSSPSFVLPDPEEIVLRQETDTP